MSAFNNDARRGPNVSQYIANLNTGPDMSAADNMSAFSNPDSNGSPDEDSLTLFTNTEFFDFDMGEMAHLAPVSPLDYDPEQEERARRQNASAYKHNLKSNTLGHHNNGSKTMDFNKPVEYMSSGDFQFNDFSGFQNVVQDPSMGAINTSQPSPYQISHQMSPPTTSPAASHPPMTVGGGKRKVDPLTDPNSAQVLEEATRFAAEEDKRRRNTAASARFRVKKKQREAALEKQAKEMGDKVSDLEKKVSQLETENKWLKGLITEKNDHRTDVQELYKKFTMDSTEPRSTGGRTDGVGTEAKDPKASRA